MNAQTAGYLMLYGIFLIVMGALGYFSNPEKAKTALMSGGGFGLLSLLLGVLGARGARWVRPVAVVITVALTGVFGWRATVSWQAVSGGQSEKTMAAILITVMLAASVALLPVLLRKQASPSEEKRKES